MGRFLLRIDVINRIIVCIGMVYLLLIPTEILYKAALDSSELNSIVGSCLMLGVSIGLGVFTLYRPYRTGWLFFFESLAVLLLYSDEFSHPKNIDSDWNFPLLYFFSIICCIIGLIINIFYLFYYLNLKRRLKIEMNEETNHDDYFHFLSGYDDPSSTKEIQKELENITKDNPRYNHLMSLLQKRKFSAITRVISYGFLTLMTIIQFIILGSVGNISNTLVFRPMLLSLLFSPLLLVSSLLYPKDFKYLYYYNAFLCLAISSFASSGTNLRPLGFIFEFAALGASFLITLIAEGRTWTGSKPD